jgi:hypothetical protein
MPTYLPESDSRIREADPPFFHPDEGICSKPLFHFSTKKGRAFGDGIVFPEILNKLEFLFK